VSRPVLLPGLRRLWRDRNTVQLGTDPRRAVVLEFADPALARVLDLLDGSRTEQAVLREAAALGVPENATEALLSTLRERGLTVDAAALVPPGLPEPVRRWLANEVAALALRGEASPAAAIRRRATARVLVSGHGRLAVPIAAALAEAGVGHVDPAVSGLTRADDVALGGLLPADAGRPRATAAADAVTRAAPAASVRPLRDGTATFVVQVGSSRPASLTALTYARLRLPHLAVEVRDGMAVVGPLVPPAGSPCLNCLQHSPKRASHLASAALTGARRSAPHRSRAVSGSRQRVLSERTATVTTPAQCRMLNRMKQRVTLSLDPGVADQLVARAGGNASAYVAKLVMADALVDSVIQHARWYADRPEYAEDAEAQRYAA